MSPLPVLTRALLLTAAALVWLSAASASAAFAAEADGQAATLPDSYDKRLDEVRSSQAIVVTPSSGTRYRASLSLLEKRNGQWTAVLEGLPAVIGKNGADKTKEGDGRTPSGLFALGSAFGSLARPAGLNMPYTRTNKYDYWIDDPSSADYNKWIRDASVNPVKKWRSFERMLQPLYRYGVEIRYNDNPVVKGKGSAIFLHVWRGPDKPTEGCVALGEADLLKLMKRLNVYRKPHIAILSS